jgi:predicted MFS family arabinose efflux permease
MASPAVHESGWGEFRRGWKALAAAFAGNALTAGTLSFYSLGVVAPALQDAFGWGLGEINGGLLAVSLCTLGAAPFAGLLADRHGVRPVVLLSLTGLAATLLLLALLPLSLPLYYGLWGLAAIAGAGTFPVTWTRLVNQNFVRFRGLALGLSFVGTGLTGFFLKPLLFSVIGSGGYRAAYITLAALTVIPFVVTWSLVPGGAHQKQQQAGSSAGTGFYIGEAIGDWRFWLLLLAVACGAIGVGGPLPTMEALLTSGGSSAQQAIAAAQIIGIAIIFGRLVGGMLLDRIWAPSVGAVFLASGALGCFSLIAGAAPWLPPTAKVFLIGAASGLETDLVAFMVARYFGLRSYGLIYGIFYGVFAIATGIGAIFFGAWFDATGSFDGALLLFAVLLALAALMILCVGRYRFSGGHG